MNNFISTQKHSRVLLLCAGLTLTSLFTTTYADETDICAAMDATIYQQDSLSTNRSLLTPWENEADNAATKYGFSTNAGTFKASLKPTNGLKPIYRLYRPSSFDFIWLFEGNEFNNAKAIGYNAQGINFYASEVPISCGIPVYRTVTKTVKNINSKETTVYTHMYTTDENVYQKRVSEKETTGEGKKFWVVSSGYVPSPSDEGDADGKFSIAVYPDTQVETLSTSDPRFSNRSQWIVDNRDEHDYRFVTHTGDMVDWGWLVSSQFDVASNAMQIIEDAGIPYSIAIGNYDTEIVGKGGDVYCDYKNDKSCKPWELIRKTGKFNEYFTANRFGAVEGAFEPGKVDNIYSTFEAVGKKWMVMTLEMYPRTEVIDWANKVVEEYADHNVMVVTHMYLDGGARIYNGNGGYGANSPKYMWDNFISVHDNIIATFSGHTGNHNAGEYIGENGNKVASFLNTLHAETPYAPFRTVEFDVNAGTITSYIFDTTREVQWNDTVVIEDIDFK